MDPYSLFVKYLLNPLVLAKEGSSRQLKYLREMEEVQYYTPEQVREIRWKRLKDILSHAHEHCPFYAERFRAAGLDPAIISSFDDLEKLQPLTKTDIQKNWKEMRSRAYPESSLIRDKTGGSTGSPLVFYYQRDRLDSRHAATIRHNRWAGWDIGDKVGLIWGAYSDLEGYKKFKARMRSRLLDRLLVLDTSSMTEEKVALFVEQLRDFRPKVLLAYTNSLTLLAEYMKSRNIYDIRPSSIVCTCEVLTPESRELIESVFGCRIFDRYGSREVAVIASECERHEGMHINADNLFLEFVRDGKNVSQGEVGEILITDLRNFGMPMIRYKIEDAGSPSNKICNCGRGLPMMEMVAGRVTDFIVTPAKKLVSGVALATYMITNIEGVQQVQLHQDEPGSLTIKLVRGPKYTREASQALVANAQKFLGSDMYFEVQFVDSIPKSMTGKSLFSISHVSPRFFNESRT